MKKLFEILKSRIEPYIGIGIVIVVVIFQFTDVKDEMLTEIAGVKTEVKLNKAAWQIDDAADEKLYMTKLDVIQKLGEDMQIKQMILEANIDGLTIAATHGADERQAQLEGRLIVLQNQVMNMTITQRAYIDTVMAIHKELLLIKTLASVSDTVIIIETDTLMIKKKGRWYWFD